MAEELAAVTAEIVHALLVWQVKVHSKDHKSIDPLRIPRPYVVAKAPRRPTRQDYRNALLGG